MTPRYGRCERGKRLIAHTPFGHWKTTTFLAALRYDGVTAPCVFDGPINGARFLAYVEQMLVPTLSPGEIVLWTISVPINAPAFGKPSKPRVRPCASCQPTARTSIPSSRSSPSSKTHCAKWHAEPSMHSGTQSELPSMTFPQKNASTIFAMPDMGPPNQDTRQFPHENQFSPKLSIASVNSGRESANRMETQRILIASLFAIAVCTYNSGHENTKKPGLTAGFFVTPWLNILQRPDREPKCRICS